MVHTVFLLQSVVAEMLSHLLRNSPGRRTSDILTKTLGVVAHSHFPSDKSETSV